MNKISIFTLLLTIAPLLVGMEMKRLKKFVYTIKAKKAFKRLKEEEKSPEKELKQQKFLLEQMIDLYKTLQESPFDVPAQLEAKTSTNPNEMSTGQIVASFQIRLVEITQELTKNMELVDPTETKRRWSPLKRRR